jgi:hypothetical protein
MDVLICRCEYLAVFNLHTTLKNPFPWNIFYVVYVYSLNPCFLSQQLQFSLLYFWGIMFKSVLSRTVIIFYFLFLSEFLLIIPAPAFSQSVLFWQGIPQSKIKWKQTPSERKKMINHVILCLDPHILPKREPIGPVKKEYVGIFISCF